MLQSSETSETANEARREWMGLLARAPVGMLEAWRESLASSGLLPVRSWLRRPETGLVMLRARIGGKGDRFNVGEMTLTRCVIRIDTGEVGVAYVGGRSALKAELAALADAMLQSAGLRSLVMERLIQPLRAKLATEAAGARGKAASTRVDFFTVAREAGA